MEVNFKPIGICLRCHTYHFDIDGGRGVVIVRGVPIIV